MGLSDTIYQMAEDIGYLKGAVDDIKGNSSDESRSCPRLRRIEIVIGLVGILAVVSLALNPVTYPLAEEVIKVLMK